MPLVNHNLVVLITGCDSGIGLEMAKNLHDSGFTVIATCLKSFSGGWKELTELSSNRLITIEMDITSTISVSECRQKVGQLLSENNLPGLWCLVNNAGLIYLGEIDWILNQQCLSLIDTNIKGTFRVIKYFLDLLEPLQGRIIVVSTVCRSIPFVGCILYNMTKFTLDSLSKSLREELITKKIRVIIFRPGDYTKLTNILDNLDDNSKLMWRNFGPKKRLIYDYFFAKYYHECKKNYGIISFNSYQESPLRDKIVKAITANCPSNEYVAASFKYNLICLIMDQIPTFIRSKILNFIHNQLYGSIKYRHQSSSSSSSAKKTVVIIGNCSQLLIKSLSKKCNLIFGCTNINGSIKFDPIKMMKIDIHQSSSHFQESLEKLNFQLIKKNNISSLIITRFTDNCENTLLNNDFDQQIDANISFSILTVKRFLHHIIDSGGDIVYLDNQIDSTNQPLIRAANQAHRIFFEGLKAEMIKLNVNVKWINWNMFNDDVECLTDFLVNKNDLYWFDYFKLRMFCLIRKTVKSITFQNWF